MYGCSEFSDRPANGSGTKTRRGTILRALLRVDDQLKRAVLMLNILPPPRDALHIYARNNNGRDEYR